MNSQDIVPLARISSSGIANNQINYIIGTINVEFTFTLGKETNSTTANYSDEIDENSYQTKSLTYFPNPTNDKVYILSKELSTEIEFEVYNSVGQLIFRQKRTNNYLDFSNLVKGVYLIVPISQDFDPFKILKN